MKQIIILSAIVFNIFTAIASSQHIHQEALKDSSLLKNMELLNPDSSYMYETKRVYGRLVPYTYPKDTLVLFPGYTISLPPSYNVPNYRSDESFIYVLESGGFVRITFGNNFECIYGMSEISDIDNEQVLLTRKKLLEYLRNFLVSEVDILVDLDYGDEIDDIRRHHSATELADVYNSIILIMDMDTNDTCISVKFRLKGYIFELFGIKKDYENLLKTIITTFSVGYQNESKRKQVDDYLKHNDEYNKPTYFP